MQRHCSGVVACCLLVAGCAEPDFEIVGRCEPITDAVRLDVEPGHYVLGVGTIDGYTLLIWGQPASGSATADSFVSSRWYDQDLLPVTGVRDLGTVRPTHVTKLVPYDGALYAQLEVDATGSLPAVDQENAYAIWRFSPPLDATVEHSPVWLPITRRTPCPGCEIASLFLGSSLLVAGAQGRLPAAVGPDGPAFAHSGIPDTCLGDPVSSLHRLLVVDRMEARAVTWGEDPCLALPRELTASNPELVHLATGGFGALFRLGDGGTLDGRGDVHYLELNRNLEPLLPARRVGGEWVHVIVDSGYQPKAAAVAGNRILWVERGPPIGSNSCQELRVMRQDGSGAEAAPWQMPCHPDAAEWFTSSSEMVELPEGRAALVWGERSSFGGTLAFVTQLTSDIPWEEGIFIAMLTSEGRRGSEILEVADEDATALPPWPRTLDDGPFPRDFLLHAAVNGSDVTVVWGDSRSSAPGFYARRVRCTSD